MSLRCYESHPTLKVGKGKLTGGSASHPVTKTANVYVALQSGSTCGYSSDPWDEQNVVEVHYSIPDMGIPSNLPRFKKLVTWLCNQLQEGKHVHIGCIGGHGRTGTLISAIVAEGAGKKDAIQYVRKHYCKKAVESKEQVKFLMKHYGCSTAEPTKNGLASKFVTTGTWSAKEEPEWVSEYPPERKLIGSIPAKTKSYSPMASARSLWKSKN